MVELDDIAIQHGPQYLERLPPSVKVYQYNGMDEFCRVITLEYDRLYRSFRFAASCEGRKDHSATPPNNNRHRRHLSPPTTVGLWMTVIIKILLMIETTVISPRKRTKSEHLIFLIDPTTFERDFIDSDPPLCFNTSFNPKTNILVVKMLGPVHELAAGAFNDMLMWAVTPMGLHTAIRPWGRTMVFAKDGTKKQADRGWGPLRPPPDAPKRPAVVLEVASSETYANLHHNAQYWVDPTRQEANVAIGVSLDRKNPEITIDQWEWSSEISRHNKTHLTIRNSDGTVRFDPDPPPQLVIPFHLLLRRPAEDKRESDLVIATHEFIDFATMVWAVQFEQDQE
jgi:hypothetical protein